MDAVHSSHALVAYLGPVGPSTVDVFAQQLRQGLREVEQRRTDLAEEWELFRRLSATQRRRRTLAAYWCRHECPLATVFQSASGTLVHLRHYRLSPALNGATSTPAGRTRNTSNGIDKWNARVLRLDEVTDGGLAMNLIIGIDLHCHHVPPRFVSAAELLADVEARRIRTF